MDKAHLYYQHSGSVNPLGLLLMLLFGSVTTAVLSVAYGYAVHYCPLIYINFFLTLGYGLGVGMATGQGAKLGKLRAPQLLGKAGFCFGLLALYLAWVVWIFAVSEQEALAILPGQMLSVMRMLAKDGAWSIFGWSPAGAALYTIWGIEAVMIVFCATASASFTIGGTPYCERCSTWMESPEEVKHLEAIPNIDSLTDKLEAGDFAALLGLKRVPEKWPEQTQLDLLQCSGCQGEKLLSVKAITVGKDEDGKEDISEDDVVDHLIVNAEMHGKLLALRNAPEIEQKPAAGDPQ